MFEFPFSSHGSCVKLSVLRCEALWLIVLDFVEAEDNMDRAFLRSTKESEYALEGDGRGGSNVVVSEVRCESSDAIVTLPASVRLQLHLRQNYSRRLFRLLLALTLIQATDMATEAHQDPKCIVRRRRTQSMERAVEKLGRGCREALPRTTLDEEPSHS